MFNQEKIDKIIDDEVNYMMKEKDALKERLLAAHREECPNPPGAGCEEFWMILILSALQVSLEERQEHEKNLKRRFN